MNVIKEMLSNIETTPLQIGRVGENLHTQVRINCITIFQDYPDALVDMAVVPPVGDAYPAIVERDGVVVVWDVLSSDLAYEGMGQIQLTFRDDEEIIKTVIGSTTILPSIEPTGEAPTPIANWIDEANEILDEFGDVTNMTASAETVAAGESAEATVSKVDGHFNINFKIPRGASGNETIDDTAGIGDTDKVWSADKDAKEISALKSAKAPIITESISTPADVQTFTDGADGMPVKTLTVGIEPVQDLHGQDAPYPAGGGKNLLKPYATGATNTNVGVTATQNADGSITFDGTATGTFWGIADSPDFVLKAGSYILCQSEIVSGLSTNLVKREGGTTTVIITVSGTLGSTFTIEEDTTCYFYNKVTSGTVLSNKKMWFWLEAGSTRTTWTPYSNICPITGHTGANVYRTGKNLCPIAEPPLNPFAFWGTSNVAYVEFLNTLKPGIYSIGVTYEVIEMPGNGKVAHGRPYIIANVNGSNVTILGYSIADDTSPSVGKTYRDTGTFTITEETAGKITGCYFYCDQQETHSGNERGLYNAKEVQLELGSTASDYTPYVGNVYPITFPSEAGTVYGGTLTIHQDGTGTLVVDRAEINLGSLSWGYNSTLLLFNASYSGIKKPTTDVEVTKALSNVFKTYSVNGIQGAGAANGITIGKTGFFDGRIVIKDTDYTDDTVFKSALTSMGAKLVCEVADATSYTLTNQQVIQLLSFNNIWADTGKINAVEYPADTKLYIDKKLTELQALVLEN